MKHLYNTHVEILFTCLVKFGTKQGYPVCRYFITDSIMSYEINYLIQALDLYICEKNYIKCEGLKGGTGRLKTPEIYQCEKTRKF